MAWDWIHFELGSVQPSCVLCQHLELDLSSDKSSIAYKRPPSTLFVAPRRFLLPLPAPLALLSQRRRTTWGFFGFSIRWQRFRGNFMPIEMQTHTRVRSRRSLSHSLGCARKLVDSVPTPPSLVNSHYLSSPNSIFFRKSSIRRWPSRENDEWLRDMVPVDSDITKSEETDSMPSSCTSADSSYSHLLLPSPSPILRPRSSPPHDVYMTSTHIPLAIHCTRYYGQSVLH